VKINDIDKFGHCVVCNKNLIRNVVINGKVEGTWHPNKDEAYMKLNQGSLMPVSICKPCKKSVDLTDPTVHANIMKAVHNGWLLEIDHMKRNPEQFKDFTPEKEESVRKMYAGLSIVGYEKNHKVGIK
jgi:hypothetical protein